MVEIKLKDNQSGYDAVFEYIKRYWKHEYPDGYIDGVVVSLATSYDGKEFDSSNEFAAFGDALDLKFSNDWWEGEKFIRIYGIQAIEEIPIYGGIYDN